MSDLPASISHIDHINIVVTNLEESTAFFVDLGFEVQATKSIKGAWIDRVVQLQNVEGKFTSLALPEGQTVIELLQYESPQGSTDPELSKPNQIGFRHMALRVKNIEDWYEKLASKGIEFFSEIQEPEGVGGKYASKKLCYFLGPDGIVLELMEYTA